VLIRFQSRRLSLRIAAGLAVFLAQLLCTQASLTDDDIRLAPGDQKHNYHSPVYQTDSLSLQQRIGKPADLHSIATTRQLGLPALTYPADNQPDSKQIALGRKLFFDRRLSRNQTMSCAMCHIPEQGFTSNELSRPIGFEGRSVKRNAPSILNVAFYSRLFFDMRESTLEQQVWSPLLASNEMNNPSIGFVIETIQNAADYKGLFEQAFSAPVNMQNIGLALAQYERALQAANSPFDRWLYGGEKQLLNETEIAGYELFVGKAACVSCHSINSDHALLTDNAMHNTGIGFSDSMLVPSQPVRVQLAPGVSAEIDQSRVATVGTEKANDLGRYEVTLDPQDRWKFRTPTLRNIELTAPYMHNGEFPTLESVLEFYNKGGIEHELLSPLLRPLNLSSTEQKSLIAFLKTLTGDNVKILVSDAFAAPVGDPDNTQ